MLLKARKRVGISSTGLDINWMNQKQFKTTKAILNPFPTLHINNSTTEISLPANIRKGFPEYYKYIYEKSQETVRTLQERPISLEEIQTLFIFDKAVKVKESRYYIHTWLFISKRCHYHSEKAKRRSKSKGGEKVARAKKDLEKEKFYQCKNKCICGKTHGKCEATELKE